MKTEILEQYKHIRVKIAELDEQKKVLEEKIVSELQKNNLQNYECDFGKFILKRTPTYEYSERVKELESKLRAIKKDEIENGAALVKTNKVSINFRSN